MKQYKILSSRWYQIFKYASAIALPALAKFVLAMGDVWSIPHATQVSDTLSYIGILMGALIVADEVTAVKEEK